jgi:hypothetical protein
MTKPKYLFSLALLAAAFFSSCDSTTVNTTVEECTNSTSAISTNARIVALKNVMLTFRTSLSEAELAAVHTCLDNERFYLWHNTPGGDSRGGLQYSDLSATQLSAFKDVLQAFLSTDGYKKVDDITTLAEGFLSDINSNAWGTEKYAIELFGDPATSGSWGFQLDGHHCAINFLVDGEVVSMVPAFLAAEPVAETHNGTAFDIFQKERDGALTLYNLLTTTELVAATSTRTRAMEVGPAARDGDADPYRGTYDYSGFATGLKYSDMSAAAQAELVTLMKEYVYNLETEFADEWWVDINTNLSNTYFVWIDEVGNPSATTQFYYRIYNPYLWVEYNMEDAVGQGIQDHNHIHTITRIPNGPATANSGDYGTFAQLINRGGPSTLYEHYALEAHHAHSSVKFDYTVKGIKTSNHSHNHSHNHGHSHK